MDAFTARVGHPDSRDIGVPAPPAPPATPYGDHHWVVTISDFPQQPGVPNTYNDDSDNGDLHKGKYEDKVNLSPM